MSETAPLYWADFEAVAGIQPCAMCGDKHLESELVNVQMDEPGAWAKVCKECAESYSF